MSAVVSVLVPSFHDYHLLGRTLPRILEGSTCELEVVVLNNDAAQVTQVNDIVRMLADPRIRILELEHRAGFAKAINRGIAATAGELVCFANSDLFIAPGYLDELVRFFARRPEAGCATGKILRYDLEADRETDIIDTTGHVISRNRRVVDRGENQRDIGRYEREEEVFGVSGAALVARRTALESIRYRSEYLDESFHIYKEDVDLCWRLRLMGWECWYVPSAVAFHARTSHGTPRTGYLDAVREFHANEQHKPTYVRMNSMKNHWLVLVKNDDLPNVGRDLPYIVGRETLILGYNAFSAPLDTVRAVGRFLSTLPRAVASRRVIKAHQKVSPSDVRRWFIYESHPA